MNRRNTRTLPLTGAGFALLTALSSFSAFAAPPMYRIDFVKKGKSTRPTVGYTVNEANVVAGQAAYFEGGTTAFVTVDGKAKRLENPSTRTSSVYGMNQLGATVGHSEYQAYLWDSAGVGTDLNALLPCTGGPHDLSYGYSINDAGTAVGTFDCDNGPSGSFLFQNGTMSVLPDFGGGNTVAVGINQSGQVVGSSEYPRGSDGKRRMHAFVWKDGVMTDIGTLPGDAESEATAVNDLGHVIGRSNAPDGTAESFVRINGALKPLPRCGGNRVITESINNKGQIVGSYYNKRYEAALIQQGKCYQLNALLDSSGEGWWGLQAKDINDAGVIVGSGHYGEKTYGFIATPIKP